uniref:AB hydrolase-1 domain-containing protein n=1 Tax=Neolamprologus brichardi TaxID=32507 RepID=A0A3Q4FX83_NEOBR
MSSCTTFVLFKYRCWRTAVIVLTKDGFVIFGCNIQSNYPTLFCYPRSSVASGKKPVNGVDLYYEQTGRGKHAVLLLPGSTKTDFGPQLKSLAKERFSVVGWDPRGYGQSRPPDRDFPPDCFERDAKDAVDLMKATNKSPPFSTYLLQYFVCQSNCFLTIIITLMQIYISKSLATYELHVQCVKLEGCRIQHSCCMLVSFNNILIFSLIFLFDLVIVYYMFQ